MGRETGVWPVRESRDAALKKLQIIV